MFIIQDYITKMHFSLLDERWPCVVLWEQRSQCCIHCLFDVRRQKITSVKAALYVVSFLPLRLFNNCFPITNLTRLNKFHDFRISAAWVKLSYTEEFIKIKDIMSGIQQKITRHVKKLKPK